MDAALKARGYRPEGARAAPLLRAGTDFLLDGQNDDGSWGDTGTDSVYANYHTTLAAAGGLTRVRWRATRLAFPELKTLIRPASSLRS